MRWRWDSGRALPCLLALFLSAAAQAEEAKTFDRPVPAPGGPFGVGTAVWHWPDPSRPDGLTPAPGDVREVMAQAWYPADARATEPTDIYAPLDREVTHATGWSQAGAPFAAKIAKAPVIVLCPGMGMARYYYTSIAEDLASHGYVVLAVDSPHLGYVIYPDGREIQPAFLPTPELRAGPYEKVDEFWDRAAPLGTGDILFAVKSFERMDRDDPARRLTGRLDWTRLGAFGHSLGSRTCGGAVLADPRFAAFAAMEGPLPRDVRKQGVGAALLMMMGSNLPEGVRKAMRDTIPARRADLHFFTLDGFTHGSVSDLPFLEPGQRSGGMDPRAALERTREVLRTFFDQYVRGTGPGLPSLAGKGWGPLETFSKPNL